MSHIEFHTLAQQIDQIPRPYPASKAVPEWVKAMPMDRGGEPTLKRCPPLLEAMTAGYIIPAPCDMTFDVSPDGGLSFAAPFNVLAYHPPLQYQGSPLEGRIVVKFRNPWVVRTPPGYSTLVTAPMNRFGMPFIPLSGVIETESYYREVHLPMVCLLGPGQHYVLPRGTPMVQLIPFRREAWTSEVVPLDTARRDEIGQMLGANRHAYKDELWRKLEFD